MRPSNAITVTGELPGPTVAIFAGVHGNELAGVYALDELIPTLTLKRGTAHFVFANPPAIAANVRMLAKNLNRCFYRGNSGPDYEDTRARELMSLLDTCDALLDLHMFYDDTGEPFVICEPNAFATAKQFDVPIISTNWSEVEPGGTDGYMFGHGKIGICIECGPIAKAVACTPFAKQTVLQFLDSFAMLPKRYTPDIKQCDKRHVRAKHAVYKSSPDFVLTAGYKNFQKLIDGELVAKDSEQAYVAKKDQCIIFPHYQARVSEEAYIIGEELGKI
jgi:succinylglutamate desuccinylase